MEGLAGLIYIISLVFFGLFFGAVVWRIPSRLKEIANLNARILNELQQQRVRHETTQKTP